jgi:proline iminopeptidase
LLKGDLKIMRCGPLFPNRRLILLLIVATILALASAALAHNDGPARSIALRLDVAPPGRDELKTEEGYVTTEDGVRLFYRKVGAGAETVLIPYGFQLFDDFKRLARGRTLIFYDMRNRGRSSAVADGGRITIQDDVTDLERIRQHFRLKKVNLIGESYLGLMVVMYAMKHPQNVGRIIQIGPVPLKFDTRYPANLTANDEPAVPDPAAKELKRLREEGYDKSHPKEYCEKEWMVVRVMLVGSPANAAKIASPCDMPNEWPINFQRHLNYHFDSVQRLNISKEAVARVSVPVLTIHGTRDRNAAYGSGREWAHILPNARLVTVNGAAHFPWVDAPGVVFPAIATFLNGKWPERAERVTAVDSVAGRRLPTASSQL